MSHLKKGLPRWIQFVNVRLFLDGPARCFRIKELNRTLVMVSKTFQKATSFAKNLLFGRYVRPKPCFSLPLLPQPPELLSWGGVLIPGIWYSVLRFLPQLWVSIAVAVKKEINTGAFLRSAWSFRRPAREGKPWFSVYPACSQKTRTAPVGKLPRD